MLASLVLCIAFHLLARRAKFGASVANGRPLAPASVPTAQGENADHALAVQLDRLSHSHDLSPREREIMYNLAKGQSNDEIAAALFISPETARTHVQSILKKLDVPNRGAIKKDFLLKREKEG